MIRSAIRSPLRQGATRPTQFRPKTTASTSGIITANRQLWLAKGGASGATWTDASGNSRNMTLVGSPTIGASSVTFNGSTQYGTIAATGVTTACSIYLRFKQIAWTANARIVSSTSPRIIQSGASPNVALFDSDATPYATNSGAAIGSFVSFCYAQNGTASATINVNGTETSQDNIPGDAWPTLSLAATSAGASPANIEVVELVMYNVAHDATQRAQMSAYLGTL